MLVRFSDQDEFVAELSRDPVSVARGLVRCTLHFYPVMNGTLTRCVIVGTAKVLSQAIGSDGEQYDLLEYKEFVGDLWGHKMPHDEEVNAKAQEMLASLERKLVDAQFTVAAGRYEVPA